MPWFRISFAEKAFLRLLGSHGWALDTLTVDQGLAAMREFHREHHAQHTRDGGEDSLSETRRGDELVVTRRMTRAGDRPETRQLTLRLGGSAATLEFTAL